MTVIETVETKELVCSKSYLGTYPGTTTHGLTFENGTDAYLSNKSSAYLIFRTSNSTRGGIHTDGRWIIGDVTPVTNCILTLNSTTQAFRPPSMTTAQKNAIGTPSAGMVVYDASLNKLCVYTGAAWETITSA